MSENISKSGSLERTFASIAAIKDPVEQASVFAETLQILNSRAVLTRVKFQELMTGLYELIEVAQEDDPKKASELWARTVLMFHENDMREAQYQQMQNEMREQMQNEKLSSLVRPAPGTRIM